MSIPIKLHVDLETARGVFRVTRDLRSLSFRSVVPGGFASCQIALDRPLDVDPVDIAYYGTLTVSDGRHGGVVWQGRLEDPSRGVGSDGRIWDVAAVGPSAHTEDQTVPLVYVYRDLSHWERRGGSKEAGVFRVDPNGFGDGVSTIFLHAPAGSNWVTNDRIRAMTRWVENAGQNLSRVNWNFDAGAGNGSWDMRAVISDNGTQQVLRSTNLTTVDQGLDPQVVGTDFNHPKTILIFELINVTDQAGHDTRWTRFWDVRIRSTLFDAEGNELTSGSDYTADTVLASEVVTDLLGRLLHQFDGSTASIATTTTAIEQLAYPDGVTPRDVLRDLALFEPDHYWAAWEKTANDKFRFEYTEWPTTVAYEATADDGYSSSGSAVDLYNQVTVRWRDASGKIRTTTRTATVDVLDNAELTRTGFIDLGDEAASAADAIAAGDNFLSEHGTPPNAGQLTIARPILDHDRGRMVQPWEIIPGKLIRVRGIQPRIDALNPGGRDGVTVFRVIGNTYDSGSASATLELDSQPLTVTHALANLPRPSSTRERRR